MPFKITYLDLLSQWFVLQQQPLPQQCPSPALPLLSCDCRTQEYPSTQFPELLLLHSLFHPVQPFGSRAAPVVRIPVAGYRIVHIDHILVLADCTARIGLADSDMAGPAAAVVVAVADLAVAAREASVAEAGLAEMVVAVVVAESDVQAEAHPLAAKVFLSAVQAESAAEKEVSAVFAETVEGGAVLVRLAQTPTVHLMR